MSLSPSAGAIRLFVRYPADILVSWAPFLKIIFSRYPNVSRFLFDFYLKLARFGSTQIYVKNAILSNDRRTWTTTKQWLHHNPPTEFYTLASLKARLLLPNTAIKINSRKSQKSFLSVFPTKILRNHTCINRKSNSGFTTWSTTEDVIFHPPQDLFFYLFE